MTLLYEYRTIRVKRGSWARVTNEIFGAVEDSTRAAGGSIFAVCAGLIGLATDEGIIMRAWDENALAHDADATLAGVPFIQESTYQLISPTLLPVDADPPDMPGVYAHSWLCMKGTDWGEFQSLCEKEIWPYFESLGCEIVGLWRAMQPGEQAKALVVTRYSNVAHWERTRLRGNTPPGVDVARYRRAQRARGRCAKLTQRSIVRLTRLLLPVDRRCALRQ